MLRRTKPNLDEGYTPEAILDLDPLVSDTACHTRAVYLINLALKLLQKSPLSPEETEYLDACSLLTNTREVSTNPFGVIVAEKTDIDALGTSDSKSKRNKFVSSQKSLVASRTLAFLRGVCDGMAYGEKLAVYRSESSCIVLNSQKIPLLPTYASAKMMLYALAKQNTPIALTLKRFVVNNKEEASVPFMKTMDYGEVVVYLSDNANAFIPQTSAQKETLDQTRPLLAIDMVCFRFSDGASDDSTIFNEKDAVTFAGGFKNLNIAELVMFCAVSHCQYPPSTKTNDSDPILSELRSPTIATEELGFDVSAFSIRDYNSLSRKASRLGIFAKNQVYIDHVYASNLERTERALAKAKECGQ